MKELKKSVGRMLRLLDLQSKLMAFDYDDLELDNLQPLREEVAEVLREEYNIKK